MVIDEKTRVYVRIDTDKELELFCDYLNKHYPNKFHWGSDYIAQERITKDYIKKFFSYDCTLYIENFAFLVNYKRYNSGEKVKINLYEEVKVVSVYDIIDDGNNTPIIPNWLTC